MCGLSLEMPSFVRNKASQKEINRDGTIGIIDDNVSFQIYSDLFETEIYSMFCETRDRTQKTSSTHIRTFWISLN